MIGLAFGFHKTFGKSDGIEDRAFERVVREFGGAGGFDVGPERTGRSREASVGYASISDLRAAFSTALAPRVLQLGDQVRLEALFRMESARLVPEYFTPYADVGPTLRQLATLNVPRAGLSGGWSSIDVRKADLVGFQNTIVFAEDLGVDATSPAAFARVAETLCLPADRVWFVGTDLRSEIVPAAAVGMRTIWIDRDGESGAPGAVRPDATVTSFAQILDVIAEPYTRGLLALRYIMRSVLDWRPGHSIPAAEDRADARDGETKQTEP